MTTTRRLRETEPHGDTLERWEQWPMAALFAANALNVFILYVPLEEMPESIRWLLPWIKVVCGVAAALSLDGTLISVTMGRRLGRTSAWSWATIVATGVFTAAVAWYVHHAVGAAAAVLFMAQAVILVLYGQHLAQPRKVLTPIASAASVVNRVEPQPQPEVSFARTGELTIPAQEDYPAPAMVDLTDGGRLRRCKYCGDFITLGQSGVHGRNIKKYGCCVRS